MDGGISGLVNWRLVFRQKDGGSAILTLSSRLKTVALRSCLVKSEVHYDQMRGMIPPVLLM